MRSEEGLRVGEERGRRRGSALEGGAGLLRGLGDRRELRRGCCCQLTERSRKRALGTGCTPEREDGCGRAPRDSPLASTL